MISIKPKSKLDAGKPTLAGVLREQFKQKYRGQNEAAERLGITFGTLRKELSKNEFWEEDLESICQKLGLAPSTAILADKYEFKILRRTRGELKAASMADSLPLVFNLYDLRQERLFKTAEPARDQIPKLFQGLGNGDSLFLSILDELPLHWPGEEGDTVLPEVATAIINGTVICYLFPSGDLSQQIRKFWPSAYEPNYIRDKFNYFKGVLGYYVNQNDKNCLNTQLTCLEFDWPLICVPYHRFAFYHHHLPDSEVPPAYWATVTVPLMSGKVNRELQADSLIFELNRSFTNFLRDFCRRAVNDAQGKKCSLETRDPALEELFKRLNPGALGSS